MKRNPTEPMKLKSIRLKIYGRPERDELITVLVNRGYKVWLEEETGYMRPDFFVCFELNDGDVIKL